MLLTGIRCLLRGHELVQETDRDQKGRIERIRLSCIHCMKQTPGWSLQSQGSIHGVVPNSSGSQLRRIDAATKMCAEVVHRSRQ